MAGITIRDLVELTRVRNPDDERRFQAERLKAFELAKQIYSDRAASYNVDHGPTDEMPFGIISLVSEVFKRAIRMTGIVTPIRQGELRSEDMQRLADSFVDLMNYASWGYSLTKMAMDASGHTASVVPDPPIPDGIKEWSSQFESTDSGLLDPASGLDDFPREGYDPVSRTTVEDRIGYSRSAIQGSSNRA